MSHRAALPRPSDMSIQRIAVAGGTGLVGRLVVDEVRGAGRTPVVIARSTGVDLTTGAGLQDALAGADAVIDVSNITTLSAKRSVAFFEAATSHLLAAGERAGVRHHVALSIVGCDRVDLPYYRGKRRQEELVAAGPLPWTILRATQFHEFAAQMLDQSPPLLALAPKLVSQPVAVREVARLLVSTALGAPAGRAPDVGGPSRERMDDMVRRLVKHRGMRRITLPVGLRGAAGKQVAAGGLLPGDGATLVGEPFDAWLARA